MPSTKSTICLITQITSNETEELCGHIIYDPQNRLEPLQYKSVNGKPGYYPRITDSSTSLETLLERLRKIYSDPHFNPKHHDKPLWINVLKRRYHTIY